MNVVLPGGIENGSWLTFYNLNIGYGAHFRQYALFFPPQALDLDLMVIT